MPPPQDDVTTLLTAIASGDHDAWEKLISIVYKELHIIARSAMRRERPDHTLQATALVNEIYVRLVQKDKVRWQNRTHFYRAAAMAMHRILVDKARRRKAVKRGGGKGRVPLDMIDEEEQKAGGPAVYSRYLEVLDQALQRFSAIDAHRPKCRVVDLYFFANLTFEQTAHELGVSRKTVRNYWEYTKAWLLREIKRIESDGP